MPLFNDGPINQDQDLANYENGILSMAAQEQIDLGGKIKLAQQDIGRQLLTVLLKQETRSPFTNWIDPQDMLRRQIGMGDVVVTDPLQQWHAMRTLSMVYRDAYSNQLNDRYEKKWQEYQALEQGAKELLYVIGVGVVGYPLPAPAAPALTFQPGTGPGGMFWAQVTWVEPVEARERRGTRGDDYDHSGNGVDGHGAGGAPICDGMECLRGDAADDDGFAERDAERAGRGVDDGGGRDGAGECAGWGAGSGLLRDGHARIAARLTVWHK